MKEKQTVAEAVTNVIVDQIGVTSKDITPETTLESLGFDSLDTVEMVVYLENDFDIVIPDEDAYGDKFRTVGSIINYIENLRPNNNQL